MRRSVQYGLAPYCTLRRGAAATATSLLPRLGAAVPAPVSVEDGGALVVGEHGEAAGIVVVVQLGAFEAEEAQRAAERLLQVGLGEHLRRRPGRQNRAEE